MYPVPVSVLSLSLADPERKWRENESDVIKGRYDKSEGTVKLETFDQRRKRSAK